MFEGCVGSLSCCTEYLMLPASICSVPLVNLDLCIPEPHPLDAGEQVGEEKQENIQDGVLCGKRKRKESNLYQLDVPGICTLCTRRNPTMIVCGILFRIYSYYYRDLFRRY